MDLVHKYCTPSVTTNFQYSRTALHIHTSLAYNYNRDCLSFPPRYHLIARCLDIVKGELLQAERVCGGKELPQV